MKITHRLYSLALATTLTLGMLLGIDHLARIDGGARTELAAAGATRA